MNTKVLASMATGGLDFVSSDVGLPLDISRIYPIEEHILFEYEDPIEFDQDFDCPLWNVFENAVNSVVTYSDNGGYLYELTKTYPKDDIAKAIDLIAPSSWKVFDGMVRYFRDTKGSCIKPDWWTLPRDEMPEGIRNFRAKHGLFTSPGKMDKIMAWVDNKKGM
jgi:hypothetical protein